ncbi:MAG: tyrosine-type recombinase/integrase [Alphaproteobacteria bacterium]|nr:tyrosine-type recombinase/integrase [Alphaproteobacteria bacterium]
MKLKLNKSIIEAAAPLETQDLLIWDEVLPALFVCVRPSGRKSFYAMYRLRNRKQQKIKLGDFPQMSVDEAREKCRALTNRAFDGFNPVQEIRDRCAVEADLAYSATVRDLKEKYFAEHVIHKKETSAKNEVSYWNVHILPYIGDKQVRAVTGGDISFIHNSIAKQPSRTGYKTTTANRVLEILKKAFNLAEEWDWRDEGSNPCRKVKKFKERKRKRFLSVAEVQRLDAVLQKYLASPDYRHRQIARYILLLLYTGARKNELMCAKWANIRPERGVLILPDTKSGEVQELQIPEEGFLILDDIRADQKKKRPNSEYIFDGHIHGQPLKDEGRHWDNIRAEAKLADFVLHDLRHSFASFVAMTTGSLLVIQETLRHADPKTSQRYTHFFNDPLRLAVNKTASTIKSVMKNEKVVDIETARRLQNAS